MPLTELHYHPDFRHWAEIVAQKLPAIVSRHLSISPEKAEGGWYLADEDIVVTCIEHGPLDQNRKDMEIYIFAHDYPARLSNLEARAAAISDEVREHLTDYIPGIDGFVWVLLMPTGFVKFVPSAAP